MKVKLILLLALALLLLGVADSYSNVKDEYASTRVEAIAFIKDKVPGLVLTSYWEMDDGHMFEGYLNNQPVTVYWLESQDGQIEIHHKPR